MTIYFVNGNIAVANMTKRFTSFADYFARGPETQQQFADRLTEKYGVKICQASVSEAKRGRGSYARLKMFAEESGVPLESFSPRKVAA